MLDKNTTLQKMLKHFPKWMDIRKRAKTSVGGQLLESVAEESALIQEAIDDYKKDFFIESYFGKEDEIVSRVYRLQIGDVNGELILTSYPNLTETTDLKKFYSECGHYYIEDGYLFLRLEDVDGTKKFFYSVDAYMFSGMLEIMHVWNIFDEFAAFVGLTRHENESNKSLENRTLNVFRDRVNSSQKGLQYAIYNELFQLDENLKLDEIIVEGVTPANLLKRYNEFDTVLEAMAKINKDSYQYKKWDIDPWAYEIKSIDYIPHAWDVAIESYMDGVGKKDDLSITLSVPNDTTDATVMFYAKKESELYSYVESQDISTNVELELVKLNSQLTPIQSKYKITASKVYDITDSDICFEYSDVGYVNKEVYIEDYVDPEEIDTDEIEIIDSRKLPAGKDFKIVFEPDGVLKDIWIDQCDLVTDGVATSLLRETDDFEIIGGKAHYKHCKIYATKLNHFEATTNIMEGTKGLTLETGQKGSLVLNLDGMENQCIRFGHESEYAQFIDAFDTSYEMNNFILEDNTFKSLQATGDTSLLLRLTGNAFKCNISGPCHIVATYNGNVEIDTYTNDFRDIMVGPFQEVGNIEVTITATSNLREVSVYETAYTRYNFKYHLEHGQIELIAGKFTLPNLPNNKLYIDLETGYEHSPVLNFVYVGIPYHIPDYYYETLPFHVPENSHIVIRTRSMKAHRILIEKGLPNTASDLTIYDYTPHISYRALEVGATLALDTHSFSKIEYLHCQNASLKIYGTTYYLELKKDAEVSKFEIVGYAANSTNSELLTTIFGLNDPEDRIYITNQVDGFIVVKDEVETYHKLSDIPLYKNAFKYGIFSYNNVPKEFVQIFVKDYQDNKTNFFVTDKTYHGSVQDVFLKAKDSQLYVAYNEQKLYQCKRNFVEISDTFSPFIMDNSLMFYSVESMNPNIQVMFHHMYDPTYVYGTSSIGKKPLVIVSDFNILNTDNYYADVITFNYKAKLGKVIQLPNTIVLDNGDTIALNEYMINVPEGYTMNYLSIDPNQTSIETAPEYYGTELIMKFDTDDFNKLSYSNIDQILMIGTGTPDVDFVPIDSHRYTLLKDEGLIVWGEDTEDLNYQDIFVKYTIKKPGSINVSDDILYKKTNNTLKGYSLIKSFEVTDMKENEVLDLSKDMTFTQADRIVVVCTNPSYDAAATDKGIRFVRSVIDTALYAKAGYYYVDGIEYYMFIQQTTEKADKIMNVKFYNTTKEKNAIYLQKTTNNYITNSLLLLEGMGDIYSKNFVTNSNVTGASSANSITACSSFNHWKSVACNVSFTDGVNGVGLKLAPTATDGYIYLDITDKLFNKTLISLFAKDNLKAYIGTQLNISDYMRAIDTDVITILGELTLSHAHKDLYEYTFSPEKEYSYYLIVKGHGVLDDIIIANASELNRNWDYHIKNIDTLGLKINEHILEDSINRIFFYNTGGYKNEGAEMNKYGKIQNSTRINWGQTLTSHYCTAEDWSHSSLDNLSMLDGMVISKTQPGELTTEPIYVGDIRMIKTMTLQLNDVGFDQMSGFVTTVLTSDDYYGTYETRISFSNNKGVLLESEVEKLKKYIKIKITMPPNKIVHELSIFTEYKESKEATPVEKVNSNGIIISEIYNANYSAKYRLDNLIISQVSHRDDIDIYIRGARTDREENIWTNWKRVELNDKLNITNDIIFDGYQYFQFKVALKRKEAFIQIEYFDLKVVK